MPRAEPTEILRKLEEAQARIAAEIQRVKGRAAQEKRKRDTHRKILAGAMTLDRVARGRSRSSASWRIWIGFWRRTETERCLIYRRARPVRPRRGGKGVCYSGNVRFVKWPGF